ncbi:MAG: hypothetical protein DWP95_11580 [Proteobacteria bacterium]|nr:MAG: hypothetical protein DWP95_11580 [Pseudomonadota bacterium]
MMKPTNRKMGILKNYILIRMIIFLVICGHVKSNEIQPQTINWNKNQTKNACSVDKGNKNIKLKCKSTVFENISISNNGGTQDCSQIDIWEPPLLTPQTYKYDDPYAGGNQVATPNTNGFGAAFLHRDNTTKQIITRINPEQNYISISNLYSPNTNFSIKFSFTSSPGYGEQGPTTFSFSECQGNFNPNTAQCVGEIFGNNVLITNNPKHPPGLGDSPNFCLLKKNKTYFVNFVFAQPYDGTSINGNVDGYDEECLSAYNNMCALFFGEKAFQW